jgi:hypothetical protein
MQTKNSKFATIRNMTKHLRLCIVLLVFFFVLSQLANINYERNYEFVVENTIIEEDGFLIELSTKRLNKLFKILHEKEEEFKHSLDELRVFSFTDLIKERINDSNIKFELKNDAEKYIEIENNEVKAKRKLSIDLRKLSNLYSFNYSSHLIRKKTFSNVIRFSNNLKKIKF